jgi:hypothetical protein
MKIIDKTPFRSETGEMALLDKIQAVLGKGLPWLNRVDAQDKVVPVLEKQLGRNFMLLRNVTLHETEIETPLVLIGPPGMFLILVIGDRGVYRARGDEWGAISGDKFVPAKVNMVSMTMRLSQVLQKYLDRAGFQNLVTVEPILMAADPGLHIESTRPIVRIVMSDALERFSVSLNQGRAILSPEMIAALAQAMLSGRKLKLEQPAQAGPKPAASNSAFAFDDEPVSSSAPAELDFSFADDSPTDDADAMLDKPAAAKPGAGKSAKGPFGFTRQQWLILGGIVALWLCSMAVFSLFILVNGF